MRAARMICVDGVAYAPHRAIDVQALDVDFYVFSLYKTYGPHLAVMYGRHDHLLELDGLYHYFYGKEKVSAKLEPGNPNYELAWGSCRQSSTIWRRSAAARAGRLSSAPSRQSPTHEAGIGEQLLSWLRARNDVRIIGERGSDVGAARADHHPSPSKARRPATSSAASITAKIGVRHGDFHSRRLIEALDLAPGGADPRLDGALQHAGRGDPSHRSAGRRDALDRLNRSCGRPTGRTPRPW